MPARSRPRPAAGRAGDKFSSPLTLRGISYAPGPIGPRQDNPGRFHGSYPTRGCGLGRSPGQPRQQRGSAMERRQQRVQLVVVGQQYQRHILELQLGGPQSQQHDQPRQRPSGAVPPSIYRHPVPLKRHARKVSDETLRACRFSRTKGPERIVLERQVVHIRRRCRLRSRLRRL